jgi:hypothetical protein
MCAFRRSFDPASFNHGLHRLAAQHRGGNGFVIWSYVFSDVWDNAAVRTMLMLDSKKYKGGILNIQARDSTYSIPTIRYERISYYGLMQILRAPLELILSRACW